MAVLHSRPMVKEIQEDWSLLPIAAEELVRCQAHGSTAWYRRG